MRTSRTGSAVPAAAIVPLLMLLCISQSTLGAQKSNSVSSLKKAIEHLTAAYGSKYPAGPAYLKRLKSIGDPGSKDFKQLQREALLANPLVSGRPILFVTRRQYINEHGTEATMYQTGEVNTDRFRGGGALKMLELPGGKVTAILNLPQGIARDPEVHFDGKKILFSMRRNIKDDYHIYEIGIDGGNLKQLTFGARISDIQPVYMPDGKIVFSSTREPKYIPCQRHLMANLFTMNGDGSNIRQIGHNTQFEGRASLTPDGRILYTRWEYVDKHFASAYGLWTANGDGTKHALYYGGYAWQPGPIADARIIPGTQKVVAVFAAVHDLAWGAMVIVDRRAGLDGLNPIQKSWPADIGPFMKHWNREERIGGGVDSFRAVRVKYEDPYPLSDPSAPFTAGKYFLCSRQLGARKHMGLFLVDVFGNEILLHGEAPGCFDPMPIAPRKRPPVIASKVDLTKSEGAFYVQDVYTGEFMDRVKRGSVKYIRVVEAPPKRTFPPWKIGDWTPARSADSHHPVALNWNHYNNKRILGRAPVEADGSAYFKVPAGKFVYFQLLDENGMMIHSMRSGTMLQPGEEAGCVGCHEDRLRQVPPAGRTRPLAPTRRASKLTPWYGPPRNFSYAVEVQPVLDKHCLRCHDYGKKGAKVNLSGDKGPAFSLSYTSLLSRSPPVWTRPKPGQKKALVSSVGAGPIKVIPPYSWGSHQSRLIDMLRAGHNDLKLDRESLDRIVTWIDLNVPYYPSHVTYYRTNTFGRCPLDHKELAELGKLVSEAPGKTKYGWNKVNSYDVRILSMLIMTRGSPINFTRPEHSLCLSGFEDKKNPKYLRALAIIRKGKANIAKHPRLDMPGFKPCAEDQQRLSYYAKRQEIEKRNRAAIVKGQKVFDEQN